MTRDEVRHLRLDAEAPAWCGATRAALADAPDPELALRTAEQVLEAIGETEIEALSKAAAEDVAAVFQSLCGTAPFFAPILRRNPSWMARLCREDFDSPADWEALSSSLEGELSAVAEAEANDWTDETLDDFAVCLRRFKYYQLARITVRDCNDRFLPIEASPETLDQLSALADTLLSSALRVALAEVTARTGPPGWRVAGESDLSAREVGFCVLGLGKLGSRELNYSSDVDLIYVFEDSATLTGDDSAVDTGSGTDISPAEYFTRVAQRLGRLVSSATPDGFLYRIDLDLRPDGAQGGLVISDTALATYYEGWGETWEKAAFMKARPVAGDLELGWRTIRSVSPMIFRSTMDYGAVEGIRTLKAKIEMAHGHSGAGFNVKLDAGGIRDIEFISQSLQLLHGGRIPQVRDPSTQSGLERLAGVGLLPEEEAVALQAAYRYLRRVENRLQMRAERQTHVVPNDAHAIKLIARAMGYRGPAATNDFAVELERHRSCVLAAFERMLPQGNVDQIFELFSRNVPNLVAMESSRSLLHKLSENFAREIRESPDPERALNNLDRFIQNVGRRRFYYDLLADRPELVSRLTALFGSSKFLSGVLTSHPKLIEPVFRDPAVLIPSRSEMTKDLASLLDPESSGDSDLGDGEDLSRRLDALRLFQKRQLMNAGLLDIHGEIDRPELESALTTIAEVCVEAGLELARQWLADRVSSTNTSVETGRFLVVAMGKLASRELSYGSDLDVIFLFDTPDRDAVEVFEAQEYFVKLAQRFISVLQTSTGEGSCYEIDARLRPSGNQGLLVSSLAAFERYHDTSAETWERQALLRARPVDGSPELADAFDRLRREILLRDLPDDLAGEIHRVRRRMEEELAHETSGVRNFKTGRGGLLDVECAVQYLQLLNAREHPRLLDIERTDCILSELMRIGILQPETGQRLVAGWEFLQQLGNRMRVIENRSISDLDEERGDLDSLAQRMGYAASEREGTAQRAFLHDYDRHTSAVRAAYLTVLGIENPRT